MSSTLEYIEFICNQIDEEWHPSYRKMFGDYFVYIRNKPIILVCDDVAYVKKLPCIASLMKDAESDIPFQGANEWYILDIEDRALVDEVVSALEKVSTVSLKRKRKKTP
ncbi:transcriptional regulator [uncultured Sphaerochaeta sp.]|uniref:transcriptional regulator n=1 Tax=uncultured Sphaerochaeta sp. TaxID=886478 RepID=UPI002AA8F52F|nr:transcriptional regulator [uncultured Sphaerochaeta sp.]